jgi:hypothetical protein
MSRQPRDTLHLFERDAGLACAAMAILALAVRRGDPGVAIGVVGGGLLMVVSYRAVKAGVDAMLQGMDASSRVADGPPSPAAIPRAAISPARRVFLVAKFLARYALLALGAYVMLVPLHVHPLGLLIGVSSPVVAAAAEAVRAARSVAPRGSNR